jgi:hypothetical protein
MLVDLLENPATVWQVRPPRPSIKEEEFFKQRSKTEACWFGDRIVPAYPQVKIARILKRPK